MTRGAQNGFTLIELLLALALTAIVGALSYAGLDVATSANERVEAQANRIQEINIAMTVMARDFRQTQGRAIRDESGELVTAFWGNGVGESMVVFTRGGINSFVGRNRSKLQRVRYHHRDGQLVRESWSVLDRNSDSESYITPLLSEVESASIRFLEPLPQDDRISSSEWRDSWEPEQATHDSLFSPMAVEVNLELEDWGPVKRLYITSPYWPSDQDFRLINQRSRAGRTQVGSGRTQTGSGRTQSGSGRNQ